MRERLAGYKAPRWVDIVAELPKTAIGKIQRFRLRSGGCERVKIPAERATGGECRGGAAVAPPDVN